MALSFFHSAINRKVLLLVLLLAGFGLVQVYSASYIFSIEKYNDGLFFFKKQVVFFILGLAGLLFLATVSWKWARILGISLWFLSVVLIVLTLVPGLGITAGGAQRWLNMPFGFRFQPSELFKVTSPFAFMYLVALKEQSFFIIVLCCFGFSPFLLLLCLYWYWLYSRILARLFCFFVSL